MSLATRWKCVPEVEEIYLYRNTPVVIWSTSYGHMSLATLDGKFFASISNYSNQAKGVWNRRIGKRIRPRWQKQVLRWENWGSTMSQEQYERERKWDADRKEYYRERFLMECRASGSDVQDILLGGTTQ